LILSSAADDCFFDCRNLELKPELGIAKDPHFEFKLNSPIDFASFF